MTLKQIMRIHQILKDEQRFQATRYYQIKKQTDSNPTTEQMENLNEALANLEEVNELIEIMDKSEWRSV